jgi:hypothetical protein
MVKKPIFCKKTLDLGRSAFFCAVLLATVSATAASQPKKFFKNLFFWLITQ